MVKLKDRQRSVPNGYSFYLPEVKWSTPGNYPSFKVVCDGLEAVIKANPFLAKKNQWPTERKDIEDWVDLYNATVCARMGWDEYLASNQAATLPKSSPQHQQQTLQSLRNAAVAAKALVAGAKTLMEWDDSGEPPVSAELSTHRAIICTACPKNEKGDWTTWFTVPAAELIKRRIEKAQKRGLSTPRDELLHFCSACNCPLKLKVHVPLAWVEKRMGPETKAKLDAKCWILAGQ